MNRKAVTLIELLISLVILGMVMLGFSSIDLFSSRQVSAANRIIKTQNDAAYITEFIAKETEKAIGDFNALPARMINVGGDTGIALWIDFNDNGAGVSRGNGRRDLAPPDKEIAFVYRAAPEYEMRFYSNYSGAPGSYVAISKNAYMLPQFGPVIADNYLTMEIATCWDPQNAQTPSPCGSPNNPVARVRSRLLIPAASVH